MNMLNLEEVLDGLARASRVQWCGQDSTRQNDDLLRKALNLEVTGRTGCGQTKMTWKRQVEQNIEQIGLKKEDATDSRKWRKVVNRLSRNMR